MNWESVKQKLKMDVDRKINIIFWVLYVYIIIYILNSGLDMVPFLSYIPFVGQTLKFFKLASLGLLVIILILSYVQHEADCSDKRKN